MKNKILTSKYSRVLFPIFVFLFPTISSAAAFGGLNDLMTGFGKLVSAAIPITFGLALLFFFYGVAMYILRAGDEKAAKEGKSIMVYGVIAIFVISSIWGLVAFIGKELNITTSVSGSGSSVNVNCFDPNSPDGSAGC